MIKTNRFYVKSDAMKLDNGKSILDVFGIVKSVVRHKELEVALEKKAIRDAKEVYESAHPGKDVMTATEEDCRTALGVDFGEFWKARKEVEALTEECENCLPLDNYTSLSNTDKVHIVLIAHTIYNRVLLTSDIFDTEKGGANISEPIKKFYTGKGTIKAMKDLLRPVFHKLLGEEGEYFYSIKVKNSDFSDTDIKHFLANFGGVPKREVKGSEKKGYSYGAYTWIDKSNDKKVQLKAFTDLCAVILDNSDKHTVVKPEKTESDFEKAGAKTTTEVKVEEEKKAEKKKSVKKSEKKSENKAEEKKENK